MSGFVLSPRARRDLDAVWDYTEQKWGLRQAELYTKEIKRAVHDLAGEPDRGRACDDLRSGYFRYRVGSHVIFYRMKQASIVIVRILHGNMDFDRHL